MQLANAEQIIHYASKIPVMAIKNYSNRNVPDSLNQPHDAVGQDHDSVGLWQMRQRWSPTAELMYIEHQTKAFFSGPEDPNGGSPRGVLDINGWETMIKGKWDAARKMGASIFELR
ncbi:hypothetical protein MMX123_02028 [Microbacterium sp. MM2322]|uniref:hypothetical protein n=1 Tax=Microbacterium sp. MM2322 TaxID=3157631 RepID=UPI003D807EE7